MHLIQLSVQFMRALQSSSTDGASLTMHINTTLHDNPCMDDAVSALGMVLVWVSQTLQFLT